MKTNLKTLSLIIFSTFCVGNVYASEANDSTHVVEFNRNLKGDGEHGNDHLPHKAPAKNEVLPEVYFNTNSNTLAFTNYYTEPFVYSIYDDMGILICSGTIYLTESNPEVTITIPQQTAGEYTIVLEIDSQFYEGLFEIPSTTSDN